MFKRIQKVIFENPISSVGTAAFIVAFFGIISRILGLVRDRMLAANFGAGDVLDTYYAAFRLPDFIFELLVVGSLAAAFIPVFSGLLVKGDTERAQRLVSDILSIFLIVLSVFALIGVFFAPAIMHVIVPGFPADKMSLASDLTRIMFLSPLFLTMSAVLGSVLVATKRFILYASAPLLYNVGIIFGIMVLVPLFGTKGLAWGVVMGAILHFLIHVIALHTTKYRVLYRLSFLPYKNPDVRRVLHLMLPRIIGSASNQISLLLTTFATSLLAAGSLTIFTFAYNIQSVVLGLIGVSFALAAFPTLTAYFARGDEDAFVQLFEKTLRRILYYIIPMSMLFWVLRAQLVRIIYGAGHFDWEATTLTIQILSILLMSLFAQAIIPLLARTFYAMHDTRTPLYAALVAQAVNICLLLLFFRHLGVVAIAIAFSVSACVNAGILFFAIEKHFVNKIAWRDFLYALGKIIIASLIAAFVAHATKTLIGTMLEPINFVWEILLQLATAGGAGILMYLGMSSLFVLKEFETIKKKIIVRIFARPIVVAEEQNQGTGTGT